MLLQLPIKDPGHSVFQSLSFSLSLFLLILLGHTVDGNLHKIFFKVCVCLCVYLSVCLFLFLPIVYVGVSTCQSLSFSLPIVCVCVSICRSLSLSPLGTLLTVILTKSSIKSTCSCTHFTSTVWISANEILLKKLNPLCMCSKAADNISAA